MNVLIITESDCWSGVEVHTEKLIEEFIQKKHIVYVLETGNSFFKNKNNCDECLKILKFVRSKNRIKYLIEIIKVMINVNADSCILIKGNFQTGNLFLELTIKFFIPNYYIILHMVPAIPIKNEKKLLFFKKPSIWGIKLKINSWLKSIIPKKIFCVSKASISVLLKSYNYKKDRLIFTKNGVDIHRFIPNKKFGNDIRINYGLKNNLFIFGSVGRLSNMKNHSLLIKSFEKVFTKNPKINMHLVIIGEGPLKKHLKNLVEQLRINDNVHFWGFKKDLHKLYSCFDVFCLSSIGESLPISLLEAMSCGIPAIAMDVGDIAEVLSGNMLGWLITKNSVEEFAQAMHDSIHNKIKYDFLKKNVRSKIISEYNSKKTYNKIIRYINQD